MKTHLFVLTMLGLGFVAAPLAALENAVAPDEKPGAAENPVHAELREFRKGLTDAVLKGDLDRQLQHVSKDVVVTWQNGEVVRGHQGLKDFWQRNQGGASKVFQGYKTPPTPKELTILYGDTGISYGTSVAQYNLLGQQIELENNWTATLVKEDGRWVIGSYHVSNNILDNPLFNAAKRYLYLAGGISLVVGIGLGFLISRFLGRARPATA